MIKKETLICEKPVQTGRATIIPIVKLSCNYVLTEGTFSINALKQPAYIVIRYGSQDIAFDLDGREVAMPLVATACPDFADVQ
jgi:hypothetical protein